MYIQKVISKKQNKIFCSLTKRAGSEMSRIRNRRFFGCKDILESGSLELRGGQRRGAFFRMNEMSGGTRGVVDAYDRVPTVFKSPVLTRG
jgi:hypothetical protein